MPRLRHPGKNGRELIEDEIPDSKDIVFYAVLVERRKEDMCFRFGVTILRKER